ncbi:MAG: hypothetical protein JNM00_02010 [Flavobacteriales bacterium]|nr:hypothetical protein [Flavobacteriales bacterium]
MALIHALTPGSWEEMHDIVQMALEVGASLVQFHPLEWSGRAQNAFKSGLEEEELHRAYIMYHALEAEYGQKIRIHMDIVHSDIAREEPVKVGMLPPAPITDIQSLFNACRSLVLDDQGKLMPFSYGMHPDYHIGSLAGNSRQDVDAAFSTYFKSGVAGFEELLHSSYQSAIADDNDLLVWSDYVVSKSHSKSAGGVLAL